VIDRMVQRQSSSESQLATSYCRLNSQQMTWSVTRHVRIPRSMARPDKTHRITHRRLEREISRMADLNPPGHNPLTLLYRGLCPGVYVRQSIWSGSGVVRRSLRLIPLIAGSVAVLEESPCPEDQSSPCPCPGATSPW